MKHFGWFYVKSFEKPYYFLSKYCKRSCNSAWYGQNWWVDVQCNYWGQVRLNFCNLGLTQQSMQNIKKKIINMTESE